MALVTWREFWSFVGRRRNTSPANNASWILALAILALVIPANDKIASNAVFFAAHGVSPFSWIVVLAVVLVAAWLVLAGLLYVLRRVLNERWFDIVASAIVLAIAWFLVGNALARTWLSGAPNLAPVAGFVAAAAITWLVRRIAMGTVLMACAVIAAALPLVTTMFGTSQDTTAGTFTFADNPDRPSILWVISDELQSPLAVDADGRVRDILPNLQSLQEQATTYTHAYATANYTDYAVPSQLSGISDIAGAGVDRMKDIRAGIGIVPGLASKYSVVMESPIYRFDCESDECATIGAASDSNPIERYWNFAKDTAAIAGRTALAPPFSNAFPSLDGKWRDFWDGGDEFGDDAEGNSVGKVISGIEKERAANPETPVFALWHTIRTHGPWTVDRDGQPIFPARIPIVEGAHMLGADKNTTYSTDELASLGRRLYADSAVDFDRQLGELIDVLKATGQYDNTMIVVTADHGVAFTRERDRRYGDSTEQRWSEVAHVPLIVKAPGQSAAEVVDAPRSTGQIAQTVLNAAGATAPDELSVDLGRDLGEGPVFATVAGGVMRPWVYAGAPEPDPWSADDLEPPDPAHPFAVGIDPALLGAPLPEGWTEVVPDIEVLPGDSGQQALVLDSDRAGCDLSDTTGLVTSDDVVTGSVLWEAPDGPNPTRGWAIVPKAAADSYRFWCAASAD